MLSPDLQLNDGLSTWKVNAVVCGNTFRNGMEHDALAFTTYGPCGFGGMHVPNRGTEYSPPTDDMMVRVARVSPRREGS